MMALERKPGRRVFLSSLLTNFPFNVFFCPVLCKPISLHCSHSLIVFCQTIRKANCIFKDVPMTRTVLLHHMVNEFHGGLRWWWVVFGGLHMMLDSSSKKFDNWYSLSVQLRQ